LRDDLAEEVLAKVMEWRPDEVAEYGSQLQLLAAHKYDSYEGYRPGVKFLENLTGLLSQFDDVEERRTIIRFVLREMVFISRAELDHLIETVYPQHIRPMLLTKAAAELGISRYALRRIAQSDEFRCIRRKLLVLGLSDGARVDRLRRSSPLSHEQIYLATDIADETAGDALDKLKEALADDAACFEHVLLVDDFYGSGFTLLRERPEGAEPFTGRLWRTKKRLERFKEMGIISDGARVSVLVYVASEDAERYVTDMLRRAELPWDLQVVQRMPTDVKITADDMRLICESHYDPILVDHAKPKPYPMGFRDAALPLVLPHNTPNNSICILWADTTDRPEGQLRRALFPRYERHRDDRR
jgi:hypothetical protein